MKKYALRSGFLIATFLLGISVFTLLQTRTHFEERLSIEDEWHRLYEAAKVSGNVDLMNQVRQGLMCTNLQGRASGKIIVINQAGYCELRNGSTYRGDPSYFLKIDGSHAQWTYKNLDFIKSINNQSLAHQYVANHRKIVGLDD